MRITFDKNEGNYRRFYRLNAKKSTLTVSCKDQDKTEKLEILVKGLAGVTNVRDI